MSDINELQQIQDAPNSGRVLAYTRETVIFQEYQDIEKLKQDLEKVELLELHLFDDKKEYRCILTESSRFCQHRFIETVVEEYFGETGSESDKLSKIYEEEIYLDAEYATGANKTIVVWNHISYDDENGMAVIDNYRLKMKDGR